MNILVVFDHPRRDSFCGAVLDSFTAGLVRAGHRPEIADLRTEGFDPRLPVDDEPDWDDGDKVYSAAVLAEQARISRNDAIAFVFPVWWWSFPATTKGWIDRVWNNGWAYGGRKLALRRFGSQANEVVLLDDAKMFLAEDALPPDLKRARA